MDMMLQRITDRRDGLVQNGLFLGNIADPERAFVRRWKFFGWFGGSIPGEARVAEQFQPVGMALPGEQFRGTFANAFRAVAAEIAAVVEEELQERQVIVAEVAAEEKVTAQATV